MISKPITLDTHLQVPETIYAREIDNETVLLDTEGGYYFGLDTVGTRMWQLIQQHRNLRPVYDTLLEEYDVTPDQLESDLLNLVERLAEKGLVVILVSKE